MRALAAGLVAVCLATILGLAGGFVAGRLTPSVAWLALCGGVAAGTLMFRHRPAAPEISRKPAAFEWLAIGLFTLASLRAFGWVVCASGDEIRVLFAQNIGDLPKHWNYTLYLAQGAPFWPENPHLAGLGLHYPIGVDLFSALLVACGAPVIPLFVWTGLAGAAASGWALWKWGRGFALAGFLCNGGFQGWLLLAGAGPANEAWKNLFTTVLVTQRGFLYALPAGLVLMISWRRRIAAASREVPVRNEPLPTAAELLLYATMPFFHLHSFLFLSLLLGFWIVTGPPEIRRHSLRLGLRALIPATALALLVTDGFQGASVLRFQPGWMQGERGFFSFWGGEFGLFLPLTAVLLALLTWPVKDVAKQRKPELTVARAFVWPAGLLFVACALVLFAPWEWDNIKLFLWAYLAILPSLWQTVVSPRPAVMRAAICGVLFWAGFAALLSDLETSRGHTVARRSELDGMALSLRRIPIAARFGAASAYDHPLMFHGRKMTRAYEGHLLGHGLDWQKSGRWNDALMRGDDDWREAARRLEADYIFWGERERQLYGDSPGPWAASATLEAQGAWGAIYRLDSR